MEGADIKNRFMKMFNIFKRRTNFVSHKLQGSLSYIMKINFPEIYSASGDRAN